MYLYLDENFLEDQEILFAAVKQNIDVFQKVPENLLNDKEFMINCIKIDIKCFERISQDLLEDQEYIFELLNINPLIIQFFDQEKFESFIKYALKVNKFIILKNEIFDKIKNLKTNLDLDKIFQILQR